MGKNEKQVRTPRMEFKVQGVVRRETRGSSVSVVTRLQAGRQRCGSRKITRKG